MSDTHVDFLSGYLGFCYEYPINGKRSFIFHEYEPGFCVLSAFATTFSFMQFRRIPIGQWIIERVTRPLVPYASQSATSLHVNDERGEHIDGHAYYYEGYQYAKKKGIKCVRRTFEQ